MLRLEKDPDVERIRDWEELSSHVEPYSSAKVAYNRRLEDEVLHLLVPLKSKP